eukprot:5400481-Lingulodinium_polyedra.AAC.1
MQPAPQACQACTWGSRSSSCAWGQNWRPLSAWPASEPTRAAQASGPAAAPAPEQLCTSCAQACAAMP